MKTFLGGEGSVNIIFDLPVITLKFVLVFGWL